MTYAVPSHYLNQWWHIVSWAFMTTLGEIWIIIRRFSSTKMHLKMPHAKMTTVLIWSQYVQIQGIRIAIWCEVEAKVRMYQPHMNFVAIYMNKQDKTIFLYVLCCPRRHDIYNHRECFHYHYFRTLNKLHSHKFKCQEHALWSFGSEYGMTAITDTIILKPILQSKHCNSFDDSHP